MSKRYKGRRCTYCAVDAASDTADHVFAREFFLPEQRANLPKVPACADCNRHKSELEHYLATLLPFGGEHPDTHTLLSEKVPRRLANNQRLWRDLASGASKVDLVEAGSKRRTTALPFEPDKLLGLFRLIARGLSFHHWDTVIPADHTVLASLVNPEYEPMLEQLFLGKGNAYARGAPGTGSFRYEGKQAIDHPALTIWRFQIYGGIRLVGDERLPSTIASNLWVCSTPPGVANLLLEPE